MLRLLLRGEEGRGCLQMALIVFFIALAIALGFLISFGYLGEWLQEFFSGEPYYDY